MRENLYKNDFEKGMLKGMIMAFESGRDMTVIGLEDLKVYLNRRAEQCTKEYDDLVQRELKELRDGE